MTVVACAFALSLNISCIACTVLDVSGEVVPDVRTEVEERATRGKRVLSTGYANVKLFFPVRRSHRITPVLQNKKPAIDQHILHN